MENYWRRMTILFLGTVIFAVFLCAPRLAAAGVAAPNDPMRAKQTYLDQIHMPAAWAESDSIVGTKPIVVAIVDTGVDLTHPDLQGHLTDGYNLLDPNSPPQDDNGHGTNVAGIIAAVSNNDKGIAGMVSNVRLMPIKALEADGRGDESKLGEGIRYAVDHGAKIVVLSLGLNRYDDDLAATVKYAEDHDVLLVAATGNEGNSVKYPAAYPEVLAVGGVTGDNHAEYLSNFGPEVDLVAPYDVFTTEMGGGYQYMEGTSMSAPQVAAAAALGWSKYPWMKPYQIRNLLRQTAEDLGSPGWDPYTGYGLVRPDRVLSEPYREDAFEPNDQAQTAKTIPVNTMISAEFNGGSDKDWFKLDSPYDGVMNIRIDTNDASAAMITSYDSAQRQQGEYTAESGKQLRIPVQRGEAYLRLQLQDGSRKTAVGYRVTTSLSIYKDPYEPNDKQYEAYVLPAQSQIVKGTFDHANDKDWYMIPVERSGRLSFRLSTDTARMDPVLTIVPEGGKSVVYDQAGSGADETASIDVFPGNYYIRVSDVKDYINPVMGEYTLSINYTAKWLDPNEPNDKAYEATFISPGSDYIGTFDKSSDIDWYQFNVSQDSLMELRISGIPSDCTVTATLTDSSMNEIWSGISAAGSLESALLREQHLTTGTYYIKLQTDQPFSKQPYHLQADLLPLYGGYADITGHWAQDSIVHMTQRHIVTGYGNYRFMPDSIITRAESAAILSRAFRWTKERPIAYTDLTPVHWAYSYIGRASQAGIIDGYPDGTVAPDDPITRMEMASMIAKSLDMAGKMRGGPPFTDVDEDYWGAGILKQLKADGRITGYGDGTFRPEQQATRAEFVAMIERIMNR